MTLSDLFSRPSTLVKLPDPTTDIEFQAAAITAGGDPNQHPSQPKKSPAEKFLSRLVVEERVRPNVTTPCKVWPVDAAHDSSGYGMTKWRGKVVGVHKLAYALHHGIEPQDIPPGQEVMHACDNPPCGNWEHLSLGSKSDNMQDAKRKGRKYTTKGKV